MEGLSTHVYKGIKKCWNRRGYVRLSNNERKSRAQARIKLGKQQPDPNKSKGKRKRFWRFKISPRVRIWSRVGSPKKWLTRLRDAYVNMMLKISNSGFVTGATGFAGPIEYGFGKGQAVKEYDEKMIVEIYRSLLIAQGQLVPRVGNNNNNNHNGGTKINGSQNRISISTR